ncbi:MAG: multidrug DMT transporter permease [Curvibacter sp. RIFCSPHIGHO2_12_FULL_63_18]|nr:MAG: multidrug DMT transporter permease [Curvibacter sp. GWA2_63_95]OGP00279.1 MAG: multidrug DMT transporter permease [Curvibacter sp. RIFCSPHIGHO2_12_FULL_63_18]HCX82752.1 EamA/RhaT family transporter [Rhodoferax sp.]
MRLPRPEQERWALLGLWLIPALWAVNFIVARWAPGTIAPYALALGRWAIAGVLLGFVARQELWAQRRAILSVWYQYVVLGFCGMLVCGAWVYLGARTTGAMNISLIYAASPVLIAVGAVLWLGERFRTQQVLGVVVALAGVVHVIVKGQWLALGQVQWVVGDAWIVAAMVAWAAYALLQKLWPSPLGSTARLAAICAGGVLVLIPCALWEAGLPETPAWSWAATWLVLAAALAPGLAAYWIYGAAQKVLGASRVAVTLYLGPLYAALAAWGVLGEPLGVHHLVGAALILPGVYWVSRR